MAQFNLLSAVQKIYDSPSMGGRGIVNAVELGDGVIAVGDSQGGFDVYFDMTKWEYRLPEIWEGTVSYDSVGLLPGKGRAPRVSGFEDSREFAALMLQPTNPARRLHDKPRLLPSTTKP